MGETNDEWVRRVLGIDFGTAGDAIDPARLKAAITAWRDANETVDSQISKLQAVLRRDDDAEMREISEFGLNSVTGGFKAPFLAALMGAERGVPGDVAKLATIIPRFRAHLENDERVEACDDNPFGVQVAIRATLVPALDALAGSLSA